MFKLPSPKNIIFIASMLFLIISNIFLRKYYKIEDNDKAKGKKFHIISTIIYSIAIVFFLISYFKK